MQMRRWRTRLALTLVVVFIWSCASQKTSRRGESGGNERPAEREGPDYPESERRDATETLHGTKVRDPYRWLEPSDDEEVQEWAERQAEFARSHLDELPYRERLRRRFEELYYVESVSAPRRRGGRMFYTRQHPDREKAIYYWRPVDASADEEEVLLDPNEMGGDENISIDVMVPSWDGTKVAYTESVDNADEATLYVRDVDSGENTEVDVIEGARWAYPAWTPDDSGFYYTRYPTDESIPVSKRPGEADLRYHELGTEPEEDRIVHEPTGDPRTFQGIQVSRDGRWLLRWVAHGWTRTDIYLRDLDSGDSEWTTLREGEDAKYRVDIHDGDLYIRTDEGAPRNRLFRAPAEDPARENWTEIVSEPESAVLQDFSIVGGRLVLKYLKNAHSRIEIRDLDGSNRTEVELPEMGTAYRVSGQPDHETAYLTFESFTAPKQIYEVPAETGETSVWSKTDVPVDPSAIEVEQVWYESKDGTEVSMFIVRSAEFEKDGSTPFLMTGYGGFDISYTPYFSEQAIAWIEQGGGFAIPNLRGGGEYGEEWHRAGMLENKQNVFDDFIAAAEYLVDEGYTAPERLAIRGGSNGGLLVGAAMTQRPELFGSVVCAVPLLDMIRYTEFGPAKTWVHEYGDPSNPEHFKFLSDYSPYHHVQKGAEYPAVLMLSSASDDRVHPMHARKMTAALQWASSSGEPILFRLEKEAGHGGADMLTKRVEKSTDTFAFLMEQLDADWQLDE